MSRTPDTNFTVVRVKRDILRRSTVGAMFTNRSVSTVAAGSNQAYGLDAALAFTRTSTSAPTGPGPPRPALPATTTVTREFDYLADRYGLRAEFLKVGDNFNQWGSCGATTSSARTQVRFSPRPRNIRRISSPGGPRVLVNGAGDLETRQYSGRFNTEFENSDQFTVEANDTYEMLVDPLHPRPRRHSASRQLRLSGRNGVIHDGTAAAGVGHPVGAAGRLLVGTSRR